MENGDGINPGIVHQQQCSEVSGYSFDQGSLFLPKPGSDSLYYLFHLKEEDGGSISRHLLHSVVDASANGGLGRVVFKNEFLRQDTFSGMISACRHANGRDWWVVVQENHRQFTLPPLEAKGKYHFYLFDPYGIHYQGEQRINRLFSYNSWIGQSCFSPDGTRYAMGNYDNGVNLFDFDRCTGELSNPRHLEFSRDTVGSMGLAFSPNSRFLYVTTGLWILQYDMEADDVAASKLAVAYYDGAWAPLPTTFYHLALAPDGKIYGTASFGAYALHIIHQPDQLGVGCQVEQHGLLIPTNHKYTTPNFPHYRLYDVPGSVCDSLGVDAPVVGAGEPLEREDVVLYPNPTTGTIRWASLPELITVRAHDALGRLCFERQTAESRTDLGGLPDGVYFVTLLGEQGVVLAAKAVVLAKK